MAKNIQGKPQAGKVRQVRAESKISFPFPPSMLAAQITISALPERWILLPNPKKSLQRGVTEHPPSTVAIRSGHQVRQLRSSLMDLWFLILPDFLLLCLELTVMVPEKKTSCFSNEVPSEAV